VHAQLKANVTQYRAAETRQLVLAAQP
jgi:hypothetical protein